MIEALQLIPQMHPDSRWSKVNDDEYYLYNETFNTQMFISSEAMSVIKCINGQSTIKEITDFLTEYEADEEDYNNVISFICQNLTKQNILIGRENQSTRKSYIRYNKIFLKGNVINPVCNKLAFLFKPIFVFFVILAATLITSYYFVFNEYIFFDNSSNNNWIILGGTICLILFHELGHCTALKYRGLESKGIGVGIHFLLPVLFAEVTSAWSLQSKKRIVIDLGGFYFQGILTLFFFVVAIITSSGSFFNLVSLSIMLFIFNLNPFFKSDIYWSISDYFNLPNLHEATDNQLKIFFKKGYKATMNYYLLLFGLFRYIFLILVLYLIFSIFFKSFDSLLTGNYVITFWNIQRDLLTTVAVLLLILKIKNVFSEFIKKH